MEDASAQFRSVELRRTIAYDRRDGHVLHHALVTDVVRSSVGNVPRRRL